MTDTILEIAAYVCLAIGVAVLLYRALGARLRRRFGLWRFDRKLRKLDGVPDQWVAQWGTGRRHSDDHPSGSTHPRHPRHLSDDR